MAITTGTRTAMRRFDRPDEPMHAYLLIDDGEVQRSYGERDAEGERAHLRRALLRATICLVLLSGGLAAEGALHGAALEAPLHALLPE